MTIIRWMRRTTTVDIAFGSFATDPAGLACHLVSALAGKRPDCDRTRMADISAPRGPPQSPSGSVRPPSEPRG